MNPLFFGSAEKQLYGVYHPPKSRLGRETGVVLCAPFGQEYMRAHRAFRQLALLLAKAGFHVFRFDYRGTGDSWGEANRFSFSGAVDDAVQAAEELRDTADVQHVAFVGLRLGGSIAAAAAAQVDFASHMVLWDPVLDGRDYLEDLRRADSAHASSAATAAGSGSGNPTESVSTGLSVLGFPIPDRLQEELLTYRFGNRSLASGVKLLLIADPALTPDSSHVVNWASACQDVAVIQSPLPGRWDEVDNWGSAMIPQAAIQEIASWLTAEVTSR